MNKSNAFRLISNSPTLKLLLVLEQNKIQTSLNSILILILIFPIVLRIKHCINQITKFMIQECTRGHG